MKDKVLVVGSSNYDIILKQDSFATTGETVLANQMSICGGGKGANQAVQCSKLGKNTVFLGSIGQDEMGEFLLNELNKYDVCTDYIKKSVLHSGVGVVNCTPDGEVQATVYTGANFDLKPEWITSHELLFAQAKVLILQLEIPVEVVYEAITLGRKHNCYIILNAAPAKKLELDYLKLIDCLVVNETEAGFYLEEEIKTFLDVEKNANKLLSLVRDCCIVTLGKNGSVLVENTGCTQVDARIVEAIETTGAGDSYVGAFATKVFDGVKLKEACEYATLASSFTVQNIGAQSSMPNKRDLEGE